jgi:DNA replication protein DnaC
MRVQKFCKKHGAYESSVFESKMLSIKVETGCPECEKEELENEERERLRYESAKRRNEFVRNMESVGIPYRYWRKTLADFKYESTDQMEVIRTAQSYVDQQSEVMHKGISMVFCGKPGTGKTHIAIGIIHEWKTSKRYINARALTRSIRATYSDNKTNEQDVIDQFALYDLLVIDEIGKQFTTDNERFAMFDIINERYNRMNPTILVTNMTLKDMQEFLGEDTMDRIRESGGKALKFLWESARKGNI